MEEAAGLRRLQWTLLMLVTLAPPIMVAASSKWLSSSPWRESTPRTQWAWCPRLAFDPASSVAQCRPRPPRSLRARRVMKAVDEVCDCSARRQHGGAGAMQSTPRNCSKPKSMDWFPCAFKHYGRMVKNICLRKRRNMGAWYALYCAVTLHMMGSMEEMVITSFQENDLPYSCPRSLSEYRQFALKAAKTSLADCHLRELMTPGVCQHPNGSCFLLGNKECLLRWFSKTLLTWVTHVGDAGRLRRAPFRVHCWEPELLAADSLYCAAGRWHVDDTCVDVIERLSKRMLKSKLVTLYREARAMYGRLSRRKKFSSKPLETFIDFVPDLFRMLSPTAVHMFIDPMFQRMKATARRRRSSREHGKVVVSCAGLKGKPREVRKTLLMFIRLLMINELRQSRYVIATQAFVSAINMVLPCTLNSAL